MKLANGLENVRTEKVGPGMHDRLKRWLTAQYRKELVGRLQHFRDELERDMQPEPWTVLDGPMVLVLADICEALGLRESERAVVLGQQGEQALDELVNTHWATVAIVNQRQAKVLDF